MSTASLPARRLDCLVGKFFHTTRKCGCQLQTTVAAWQGRVIAALPDDHLLIETFEWIMGTPFGQEPIAFGDFLALNPIFYDDCDEMQFSYSHGRLSHSTRCTGKDDMTD